MLERHVQEPALAGAELAVEAAGDRILGGGERGGIPCECGRGVAESVARVLVEQNDSRQRATRARAPVAERAREPGGERNAEALADLAVERGILLEPLAALAARAGWEPEIENLRGEGWQRHRGRIGNDAGSKPDQGPAGKGAAIIIRLFDHGAAGDGRGRV